MKRTVCILALTLLVAAVSARVAPHRLHAPVVDRSLDPRFVHPSVPGNLPAELSAWSSWKVRHGRSYSSADEDAFRFGLFQKTLARIVDNNRRLGGWGNYGLNKFADMDPAEWANMYLSRNVRSERKEEMMRGVPVAQPERVGSIPKDVDWRQKNAVTWVKDQGQCGSCWAFSVTETVESTYAIKYGKMRDLSPQQIVDCDWGDGNQGCDGGDPAVAYVYVQKNGLEDDGTYPYLSGDSGINGTCEYKASQVTARIANFSYATPPCSSGPCDATDDVLLATNLAANGPAGIIVDASNWQDYTWGSFSDCDSSADAMDHGVQLVGFEFGDPSSGKVGGWLVRNSWGEDWGEDGYITLAGSSVGNNTCGVSNEAIQAWAA